MRERCECWCRAAFAFFAMLREEGVVGAGALPSRRALALRCAVVLLCAANHFAWADAAPLEKRHVGKTCTDLG